MAVGACICVRQDRDSKTLSVTQFEKEMLLRTSSSALVRWRQWQCMVLPVLQLLRSMFDSDAMIWVVSVGEGLSEQRISADYNTPFILSDVLQAHYDGIHSAIDPFRIGEWDGYKNEFEQYQARMAKELVELKFHLSDSSADLKGLQSVDRNKSLQIQRAREKENQPFRNVDDVGKQSSRQEK